MARSNIFGTDRPLHEFTRSTERPCSSNDVLKILGGRMGGRRKKCLQPIVGIGPFDSRCGYGWESNRVRFPFLRIPPNATRPLMSLPHIRMTRGLPADISSTEGSLRKP